MINTVRQKGRNGENDVDINQTTQLPDHSGSSNLLDCLIVSHFNTYPH